jgi:hypothetical protein
MESSMRVSVAFACLIAMGCARETSERPAASAAASAARSTTAPEAPLPETAFADSEPRPEADRFATRPIGPGASEGSPRRYHGARIDLDVKGADLQDVFRLISDVGKVNIVVAGDVTGTITLKLKSVPWDQALDVVAKAKGLTLERDGNVIIVHAH